MRKPEEAPSRDVLTQLPCQRVAFVYKRLSRHDQVQKSLYSIQMQDELERQAQQDGLTFAELCKEKGVVLLVSGRKPAITGMALLCFTAWIRDFLKP